MLGVPVVILPTREDRMPQIRDLGEFEVIRRLIAARPAAASAVVGAGDDAAVLRSAPGEDLVVTTDAVVEGRHYQPGWLGPRELGQKLALANLSDLAAMAARPRWAVISLGLRGEHDLDDLLEFDAGIVTALAHHDASLVGGNCTAVDGAEWATLTLMGSCAAGAAVRRSGALPGDLVAVTGWPGRAAAGVALAERHGRPESGAWWSALFEAWSRPGDRVDFARRLAAAAMVHAAIDISDGLGADLGHLCEASTVGIEILDHEFANDSLLERAADELGVDLAAMRFGAGDDYELGLAIAPERRGAAERLAEECEVPLAFVGRFTNERRLEHVDPSGTRHELGRGYEHFAP